jgi:hypothetical protein
VVDKTKKQKKKKQKKTWRTEGQARAWPTGRPSNL